MTTKTAKRKTSVKLPTKTYYVMGPGDHKWSIWDFGDEMTVHDGPGLLDNVVARINQHGTSSLTPGERRSLVESAASAIHTARLLDSDSPVFRQLWR